MRSVAMSNSTIHELPILVELEDCDVGGGLFHPNYFKYWERARSRALAEKGLPYKTWMQEGIATAIVQMEVAFSRPIELYEEVFVYSTLMGLTQKSMTVEQVMSKSKIDSKVWEDLKKSTQVAATVRMTLVCVSQTTSKSMPFPDKFRSLFAVKD